MSNFQNTRFAAVQANVDQQEAEKLNATIIEAQLLGDLPEFQLKPINHRFWIAFSPVDNWENCISYASSASGISNIELLFPQVALIRVHQELSENEIRLAIAQAYLPL